MLLNGLFREQIEDAALYHDAVVLTLATRHGWSPVEVANMPMEWVYKALEYDAAQQSIREVRQGKS